MDALALVGPTGTGKTAVALELAARLGAEIVCGDSRQIFRGLDVATGKPSAAERDRCPHHLFDWLEVTEAPSAGLYARAAAPALRGIVQRGRVPLVVGGSGLYLRALVRGLAPVPEIAPEVRAAVRRELEERGPEILHAALAELDPELADRLAPRDRQRVARGLEVARATGRPLSAWLRDERAARPPDCGVEGWRFVGLTDNRRRLYERLDRRAERFFEQGLLGEVHAFLDAGVPPDAPGLRSLGYAQAVAHVHRRLPYAEAVERTQRETRRYAKRQWTWWRQEGPRVGLAWVDALDRESPGALARRVEELWRSRAATPAPGTGPGGAQGSPP